MHRRCNSGRAPSAAVLSARMEQLFPSAACLPLAAAALLTIAPAAPAATIVVSSGADPGTAATCTLRQAIVSMNTGSVSGNGNCQNTGAAFGSGDTINFGAGLFGGGTATITLADQPNNYLSITDNHDLAIDAGAGRNVTIERSASAQNKFRVVYANIGGAHLSLSGLTIQNGYSIDGTFDKYKLTVGDAAGGGMLLGLGRFTLDRCTIRNNAVLSTDLTNGVGPGGGIAVVEGDLVVNSTLVTGNYARGSLGIGGGIYATHSALSIVDSTISGNTAGADHHGGAALATAAGNVVHGGFVPNVVGIANSTISGNASVRSIDGGGAVSAEFLSSLAILNSTVACNDGPSTSVIPAVYVNGSRSTSVISTLFADTSNSRCATHTAKEWAFSQSGPQSISGDHNLVVANGAIDASAPFPADTIFGDPLLGALQNNGGSTLTHALGSGSPALDKGSNPGNSSDDQRGSPFGRWVGSNPDIGAFEDQSSHLCGAAWGHSFTTLSSATPNLCDSGAYLQAGPFGSGPWSWFCAANANPVNNEFCGAKAQANTSLVVDNAGGTPIGSAVFGQPLRLKAVVADGRTPAAATPTGAVSFFDVTGGGFNPFCVDVNLSSGSVVCDTTNTPVDVGARQLKAVYNGDATFGAASSAPAGIQINPASSTTAIASQTPNPVALGTSFTVVAQVSVNTPSVATPTGSVQIDDQTDGLSCTYDLAAATPGCALTPLSGGVHTLHVAYLGNGNIAASFASGTETVTAPQLSLMLDDGSAYAAYGKTLHYVIHLNNTGNGAATSLAVTGAPAPTFNGASLSWQCAATNGATCAASGSGAALADTVTLPANSTLMWTVDIVAPQSTNGDTLQFTVSVTGVATVGDADTLVIFRDGFE